MISKGIHLVSLALLGCAAPAPHWDPDLSGRAVQAQTEFRRWGEQRFSVLSFQAAAETHRVLTDDFEARSLLYVVPFEAKVRFTAPLEVQPLDRVQLGIGAPGWTAATHRDAVMLQLMLGSRKFAAGEELTVRAAAVFEDLEPGTRFRAFDRAR